MTTNCEQIGHLLSSDGHCVNCEYIDAEWRAAYLKVEEDAEADLTTSLDASSTMSIVAESSGSPMRHADGTIDHNVRTVDGTWFTTSDQYDMARLVFKRFGHDPESATAAWRRMLQNSATVEDFMGLVNAPTHTPNCEGNCRSEDHQ